MIQEILKSVDSLLNQYYYILPVSLQTLWKIIGLTFIILLFLSSSNFILQTFRTCYKIIMKSIINFMYLGYVIRGEKIYAENLPEIKRILDQQLDKKNIGGLVALLQTNWQFRKKDSKDGKTLIKQPENLGFCEIIDQDSLVNLAKEGLIEVTELKLFTDRNGKFYVRLKLENRHTHKLKCIIPKGQIFENRKVTTKTQNIVTSERYEIELDIGEVKYYDIETFCLNQTLDPPNYTDGRITIYEIINKNYMTQDDLWRIIQFYNHTLNYEGIQTSAHQDLTKTIIDAAVQLQGRAKIIQPDEDSRNGFMASVLENKGFIIKDQTRWGISKSGKSSGEIDIKIENEKNEPLSICEGLILTALSKKIINDHIMKLFGYDPNGLDRNYVLVYAQVSNFIDLWHRYIQHLNRIEYQFQLDRDVVDVSHKYSPYSEIKVGVAYHNRNERIVEVWHVFINMNHHIA